MRQEPHRVYWQQWIVTSSSSPSEPNSPSKRELVTKSAAVRISDAARAVDVTQLLRNNMAHLLLNDETESLSTDQDALVLVATLYNAPPIQFEHEEYASGGDKSISDNKTPSEPLYICKTLKGDENPLVVRDTLLQHLKQRQSQAEIAPKLQWFFVPSSPNMPNCIELDGYCTGDDKSDFDGCDDDDESDSDDDMDARSEAIRTDQDSTDINAECWWRSPDCSSPDTICTRDKHTPRSKHLHKQERRRNQLLRHYVESNASHDASRILSGYLLKRSRHDKHVWKRVHCVLTDSHFWMVTRMYNLGGGSNTIAKHTRIALNQAMLISPSTCGTSTTSRPNYPAPFSFSVVGKNGISHEFRTTSPQVQQQWMTCLKTLIGHAQDNDLIQHAELICENEAYAHAKRRMSVAVEPLMKCNDKTESDSRIQSILTWGMDVASYREACRQVQSQLPTKRIVVSTSENVSSATAATPRQLFASSPPNGQNSNESDLDADTRDLIVSTWNLASVLLARATLYCQGSSALETLCRHVDYVITGRFRETADVGIPGSNIMADRGNDPPPMDLFDALLAELQSGCCDASNGGAKTTNGQTIETPVGK